jgi:nickel superoxide dismutase
MMKNIRKYGLFATLCMTLISSQLQAHCQVPCGIYDDNARVKSMLEDSETVSKAMIKISELSDKDDLQSVNQSVRWVLNKEKHAQNIIDTISDYFLTQRVKVSQEDYSERLIKHHTVIVNAMKSKQNVDIKHAEELKSSIEALATYYPEHNH